MQAQLKTPSRCQQRRLRLFFCGAITLIITGVVAVSIAISICWHADLVNQRCTVAVAMKARRAGVPAWATWNWASEDDEEEKPPRRCCFDEVAAFVAARVPCLQVIGALNGTMPTTVEFASKQPVTSLTEVAGRTAFGFLDALLRGASQVVVINNPVSGSLIVASLFFPSTIVGFHGVLGLLGSTMTAKVLRLDAQALTSGLFGYNGLLVGMALGTFLTRDGWDAAILIASVVMGGVSTLIQLALGNIFVPTFRTPPFTLAFNVTFLMFLLASAHWSRFSMPHHTENPPMPISWAMVAGPEHAVDLSWVLQASLVSVGQVFLCQSEVSGGLILAAMAVSSRIAAVAAYLGACLAVVLALAMGASHDTIAAGLWGYSSVRATGHNPPLHNLASIFCPSFCPASRPHPQTHSNTHIA